MTDWCIGLVRHKSQNRENDKAGQETGEAVDHSEYYAVPVKKNQGMDNHVGGSLNLTWRGLIVNLHKLDSIKTLKNLFFEFSKCFDDHVKLSCVSQNSKRKTHFEPITMSHQ